jgi:alkanesulfonate monooxygenase SsuD/methylene tetrahydromethanopterin reductase-like flavin-dependent oxidoreductase (luciferase family)
MRLGMFMQPVHDPVRDFAEVLEQDRQTVILADQLGFEEVYVGEHISATVEPITAPLVFMASLLERTQRIKFGTGVFCLPQHHPASVAAQAALFDHLAHGRFIMGIGTGSLSSDVELFDVGDVDRGAMVRESIEHVLAIWSEGTPINRQGEHWHVKLEDMSRAEFGVGQFIKPLQQPHPPIAISIMSPNSSSALMAGERGWIPISGASFLQPRYTGSHWTKYQEGAERAGRAADPSIWRVSRSLVVADSDQAALDYVTNPDGPIAFWYRYLLSSLRARGLAKFVAPDGHSDPDNVTWEEAAVDMVTWGAPDTVVDKLVALRDCVGPFGVLTMLAHEWDDVAFCQRSMRLLTDAVMPKFSRYAVARDAQGLAAQ